MDTDTRAKLYQEFLEQAAAEYRCKTTDMPAKAAAVRRLAFELYSAGLIDGRNPDPSILKWFLEEEAKHMPPPEPIGVTVEFAETLVGICEKCGHEHRPYQPPVEGARPTVEPSPPLPKAPPRPSESPTNVIEMRPRSIHDGAPLKDMT